MADVDDGGGRRKERRRERRNKLEAACSSLEYCDCNLPNLRNNNPGEGGGRALAEALRLNNTVTSFDLSEAEC